MEHSLLSHDECQLVQISDRRPGFIDLAIVHVRTEIFQLQFLVRDRPPVAAITVKRFFGNFACVCHSVQHFFRSAPAAVVQIAKDEAVVMEEVAVEGDVVAGEDGLAQSVLGVCDASAKSISSFAVGGEVARKESERRVVKDDR